MIKSILSCIARTAILSQRGSLSIIDVIEKIESPQYPIIFPNISAVFLLTRDETDPPANTFRFKVSVGENLIIEQNVPMTFGENNAAHCLFEMAGMPIPTAGIILFELLDAERVIGVWELLAKTSPQAAASAEPLPPSALPN